LTAVDFARSIKRMKITRFILIFCVLLFPLGFIGSVLGGDAKGEQALREADADWCKAAGSKDVDKTVSFYSDDATVLPANAPSATTKDAIRKIWGDLIAAPGFAISWKATKIEVAKSGDLACISGTYELTTNDTSDKPSTDHGKYVEVWEKQKDGTWKCGTDIWNSDLPAVPTSPGAVEKK
jgi:ketosteroid isomerase-like protein